MSVVRRMDRVVNDFVRRCPVSNATTGSPEANASSVTLPKVSVRLGKTKQSAEA